MSKFEEDRISIFLIPDRPDSLFILEPYVYNCPLHLTHHCSHCSHCIINLKKYIYFHRTKPFWQSKSLLNLKLQQNTIIRLTQNTVPKTDFKMASFYLNKLYFHHYYPHNHLFHYKGMTRLSTFRSRTRNFPDGNCQLIK